MTIEQAAARRTSLSMPYMQNTRVLLKIHLQEFWISNGNSTAHYRTLQEDPLRVLRAMQFSARLGFDVHPRRSVMPIFKLQGPNAERVFQEWKKLYLGNGLPQRTWVFARLRVATVLPFEALDSCNQDPQWHPEGNVWTHYIV